MLQPGSCTPCTIPRPRVAADVSRRILTKAIMALTDVSGYLSLKGWASLRRPHKPASNHGKIGPLDSGVQSLDATARKGTTI